MEISSKRGSQKAPELPLDLTLVIITGDNITFLITNKDMSRNTRLLKSCSSYNSDLQCLVEIRHVTQILKKALQNETKYQKSSLNTFGKRSISAQFFD